MLGEIAPLIYLCSMAIFHLLVTRRREPKMIHGEKRFPALGEPVEPIRSGTAAYGWEGGDASVCSLRKKKPSSLFELRYEMPQPAQ